MPQKEIKHCVECGDEIIFRYHMIMDNHVQHYLLNEPELEYTFCSELCILEYLTVESFVIDGSDSNE